MTAADNSRRTVVIAPRAARLTIAADPGLGQPACVRWEGAEPIVAETGDAIEIHYSIAARLRAIAPHRSSLSVALNPAFAWAIVMRGGVSGLRADLRGLSVTEVAISGGARDVVFDMPAPSGVLALEVRGGISRATVRRPRATPATVEINGGASDLRVDDVVFGALGGLVRHRTVGHQGAAGHIALRVRGGASGLTVDASSNTARDTD